MTGKTSKQLFFEVRLDWLADSKGSLSSKDIPENIIVATPVEFGGKEHCWSPEHLLLGAVNSCFMTTYLAFAERMGVKTCGLQCSSIGQIEMVNGRYKFTRIDVYPVIHTPNAAMNTTAGPVIEKTQKYCLISNSINAAIFYHSKAVVKAA